MQEGDLVWRAQLKYEASLAASRKVLGRRTDLDPGAARRATIDLNRVGALARQQGDLAGAKADYDESLAVSRRMALANPASALAQGDLSYALIGRGDVAQAMVDLATAQTDFAEALQIRRGLAAADRGSPRRKASCPLR